MTYRLYLIRVFTLRWEETLAFYRDVIGFPVVFADADMGWAQFDLGSAGIGLERCDPDDRETANLVGRFVGTSVEVDDIDAVFSELSSKGVEFIGPPEKQPWGATLAHFKDPDGNVQTLIGNAG
jgi:uncharacterized glyoxalase superfamily protein PhnB